LRSDQAKRRSSSRSSTSRDARWRRPEAALAQDAMKRLDLPYRVCCPRAARAHESVLGRKRALEVEIEAINAGSCRPTPRFARSARYCPTGRVLALRGDDWPDEFVGGEVK